MADSILARLTLDERQREAAASDSPAIAVTAGAGSGKTRALVARFLRLIEQGYPVRALAAITFTDKAAREMRSRARAEVQAWLSSPAGAAASPQARQRWERARADLDAARICTIHSLCAEMLRAHPAEAAIDPAFEVLSEEEAVELRAQAVEQALAEGAQSGAAEEGGLFDNFGERALRDLLARAAARPALAEHGQAALAGWSDALAAWLDERMGGADWPAALAVLEARQSEAEDDKLEQARRQVLARWGDYQQARARRDWDAALQALAALRKSVSVSGGRKSEWEAEDLAAVRQAMRALSAGYDDRLAPLIGKGLEARWALDERAAACLPDLERMARRARQRYLELKDARDGLDFDDLESRVDALLAGRAEVRARWQEDIRAILVDEFQDTNERQRRIVYALAGFGEGALAGAAPANALFVVGDAKQSIYRFRGADVAVFQRVQAEVAAAGGRAIDLDTTYRAHQALVDLTHRLMAPILQGGRLPLPALRAARPAPALARAPFIELHVGLGADAAGGRRAAAEALAARLAALRAEEGFDWGHMALLFRASSAFPVYEDALEAAGIPFVTIAGRGFYDRPEVRDLLNALAAVADPADELALAGFLRSPAAGLSDAELFDLRYAEPGAPPRPLAAGLAALANGSDACRRARDLLADLRGLAGRATAAQVLKRLLDLADYWALLDAAAREGVPQAGRMRRNIDKLLSDARLGGDINLAAFLRRAQAMRDAGAREGEAPVEAGGSVQLMTVHKAKGLEFPLAVIADAAHERSGGSGGALFDDDDRLLPDLREDGATTAAWRMARLAQQAREEAEDRRLLYVAATRAREKLIVSGHVRRLTSGLRWAGWLGALAAATGLDQAEAGEELAEPVELRLAAEWAGADIRATLHPPTPPTALPSATHVPTPPTPPTTAAPSATHVPDLVAPLAEVVAQRVAGGARAAARETAPPDRVWRVTPRARRPGGPSWVVGLLAHQALRRWRFPQPGGDAFEAFLRPFALDAGLTAPAEIAAALREARRLVERFGAHPLRAEMEASPRRHEVAYALAGDRGVIDVVYRGPRGWTAADFKTDELRSERELREAIARHGYDAQVRRYCQAWEAQSVQRPRGLLVFLSVAGEVRVAEVESERGG